MIKTTLHLIGEVSDERLDFAVICARYRNQWVFVRHKQRSTWEILGGRRKEGERIAECASRELMEETGAISFTLEPICDYGVTRDGVTSYGRLFYAEVGKLGDLPDSEVGQVCLAKDLPEKLTYPDIQPHLYQWTTRYLAREGTGEEKVG